MKPFLLHRTICLLFVLLAGGSMGAQNFEDSWEGFFSYVSVKGISQGNDKLFVGAENAVFTFDLSTEEVTTISTINGLSGESISAIHYSEEFGLLLIGYENGLMEVVIDGEEDILTVVDILDKPAIPPNIKEINHFYENEGVVYVSTEFGITVYNLSNLEFGDTFFIGNFGSQLEVNQVTIAEPFIYAATAQGIRRATADADNLIDFAQWTSFESTRVFVGAQTLGEDVFVARGDNTIFRLNGTTFIPVANLNSPLKDFNVLNEVLTITTEGFIRAYGVNFSLLSQVNSLPDFDYELQSGITYNERFYMGTNEQGLLAVPFNSNDATQILPDGPLLNQPFAIDATPDNLWVSFGEVDVNFNPFPLDFRGVSNLVDGVWTNIQAEDLPFATDLVKVTINPLNPSEVYMSSFEKGLLKFVDQQPVELFDETNTNGILERIIIDDLDAGIRIFGADFNRDNDLWFVQSKTDMALKRLSSGGQFSEVDISDIIGGEDELAFTRLKVSREGFVFFGTAESGLVGYNPSGGVLNIIGEDAGNGNLPSNNIRALEFDQNNRLWIGTLEGLRVLFNVGGFFEGNDVEAQPIIIEEDGVGQELLFTQSITDIEVDGADNKWVSTATSGVFYFSSNGQETLQRFTKDNSPLPSNNVQDIAIDETSGRVYFATINGLVAFEGNSTAPRDDLEGVYAYPNPVRPGFTGSVTIDGLTADANIKITDITGNLVFETTSEGGSVQWDTSAFGQYKVASGVYLVLITSSDNLETKISKIMIVR